MHRIKANYIPDPKKPFSLSHLLGVYKAAHPRDQPRLSELAEAYKDVFPSADDRDDAPDRVSPRDGIHVSPTTATRPQAPQADTVAPDPIPFEKTKAGTGTPGKQPTQTAGTQGPHRAGTQGAQGAQTTGRQGTQRAMEYGGHVSTAVRLSGAESGIGEWAVNEKGIDTKRRSSSDVQRLRHDVTGTTNSMPSSSTPGTQLPKEPSLKGKAQDPTSNRAATSKGKTSSTLPPKGTGALPGPLASTPSGSNSETRKVVPDHRTWLIKRIESDQRRLRTEHHDGADEAGARFREFAHAWNSIRPGGAHVKGDAGRQDGQSERRQAGRLGMLGWEL